MNLFKFHNATTLNYDDLNNTKLLNYYTRAQIVIKYIDVPELMDKCIYKLKEQTKQRNK